MKYRPEYDKELIGKNLRRCRQAKGFSVEQVREYLRIGSIQAIYKWEEGKSYPQTDTMFALMELYDIGIQDLLYKEKKEMSINIYFEKDTFFAEREKESRMKRLVQYLKRLHKIVVCKNRAVSE